MGIAIVTVWTLLTAIYLVRQWWVGELAQVCAGVDEPAPVALPAASQESLVAAQRAGVLRVAGASAR